MEEEDQPNVLGTWVDRHGPEVLRLIRRTLGPADADVEDCFQDSFVEWFTKGGQNHANPGALLRRIAATNAIDRIRRRQSERRMKIGLAESIRTEDLDASVGPQARDLLSLVHQLLGDLPPPQAQAFVMTQLDDMSYDEVAEVLDVETNHVGVLVHRARSVLKEKLSWARVSGEREVR